MKRIDLSNPVPREPEVRYSEFQYNIEEEIYLSEPGISVDAPFLRVLGARHSKRTFKAVSAERLNALLWHSARAIIITPPRYGSPWQHRPAPSAGGRHPIDLLIIREPRDSNSLFLYDPIAHGLYRLRVSETSCLYQLVDLTSQVIPLGGATIILFGAQFARTQSKYENGESLVWRDAGALISIISLVAEYLELNCCALGFTGEPLLSRMLHSKGSVIGVG